MKDYALFSALRVLARVLPRASLLMVFSFSASASVHAQQDVCGVTTYWWDQKTTVSSSRFNIGAFHASVKDGETFKTFRHKESDVTVTVGVNYFQDIVGKGTRRVRLAIAFTGNPEDVFDELDRAEAEAFYDKNWRGMSVSRSIQVDNRVYTFTLSCGGDRKRRQIK
jgi:hypothetical protein